MLAGIREIELVLAGRTLGTLQALQATLLPSAQAATIVATFDRKQPNHLANLRPWLVIDAAGPFQDGDYSLAIAAIRAQAHYLDLADGRAFVAGFQSTLDQEARSVGVVAISGASSTPALSHAALEQITAGWSQIDNVLVAISPGARAPRGLSVIQAILSYVGQPVTVFVGGRWRKVRGWSGARRIDMPGLGRRWVSICETPDLDLLPRRFPVRSEALFMAGLELSVMHLGLWTLSLLVRLRLARTLLPLAAVLRGAAGLLAPFGTDRGGMVVAARGCDENGETISARWALWAEANAGPNTPAAPAAALVRLLAAGAAIEPGAMTSAGLLPLPSILRELGGLPIGTRADESHPHHPALFRRLLGRRFLELPAALRRVHEGRKREVFQGRAIARIGRGRLSKALMTAIGLPSTGRHDLEVTITPDSRGEIWTRRFGSSRFSSRLNSKSSVGTFEERFGLLRFSFRLDLSGTGGVGWRNTGWNLAGLPLPRRFAPAIRAGAGSKGERYRFSVVVAHRWTGLLFAYRGYLAP
jgi:saccharopine dehydrogenase-like NADP-dependent oxidoreductase